MKNQLLATGDEFQIKFLDMVDVNIFTTTALEGGLLASPCIRFNKEGILLTLIPPDDRRLVVHGAFIERFCWISLSSLRLHLQVIVRL
nr:topless-related protein 4 [Quercus suber]